MSSAIVAAGNRMIEARRRQDNAYKEMEAAITHDKKITQLANFEVATTQKIERRNKQQLLEAKRKEYEAGLLERRRRLADLYNEEIIQWRKEVLAKVETPEDRKKRIMERAYQLRDTREKARQEYVQKRLDDQWRDSCDDARTLDSKAMVKFLNQERLRQIQEKIERKQQLSSQEDSFLVEWNRQLDELAKRDTEKAEYRRRIDRETSEAVRNQIEYNAKVKEEFYRNLLKEDEEELARLRRDIENEENQLRRRREEAHARGREVTEFNKQAKLIREEEASIEREENAILLDYALRKEQEQIAAEEAKRLANRQAALKYKKFLEEQMVKEAEDTAFVDEVRRREEEKVWKARDDALQAREDARKYLMKMVDEGRQEQIHHKYEQLKKEKEEDYKFLDKFAQENQESIRKEREESERRRQIALRNKDELNTQILTKKQKEELERQEAYLADKQMQYRERLHQQRLAEQAGSVRLNYPLQKNNWYT